MPFADTELILSPEGRVYHINLLAEDIADDVILVGDPNRVKQISKHFSKIEFQTEHREFITHTGFYKNKRITVISTGIGTDNIDIVVNELDAAVNINPSTRELNSAVRKLRLYRLGTSGSLQPDIPVDSFVASTHGIGTDGLLNFYNNSSHYTNTELEKAFIEHMQWKQPLPYPYIVAGSEKLLKVFSGPDIHKGITITAPGFYAPQGRSLRLSPQISDYNERLSSFRFNGHRITNFEMETSALYGLGAMLGHECLTVCVIIGSRFTKEFSKDYKKSVEELIAFSLDRISAI
ncbi:MAG: nucleoside phosphorylase [Bacteroidia bacterium]|nr:nucleoside phosphorylase [Bacteroidia bacterium]